MLVGGVGNPRAEVPGSFLKFGATGSKGSKEAISKAVSVCDVIGSPGE